QSPRPKRNGFRATLVLGRLDDLRDVGQEAKAVEKRKHGERGICDCHAKAAAWSTVGRLRRPPYRDMSRLPRLPLPSPKAAAQHRETSLSWFMRQADTEVVVLGAAWAPVASASSVVCDMPARNELVQIHIAGPKA